MSRIRPETGSRRRLLALAVPIVLAAAVPAAAHPAEGTPACGGSQQVETLDVRLGRPPATVPAGTRAAVAVSVTRAAVPVGDTSVLVALRHGPSRFDDVSYAAGTTDVTGRVVLLVDVPRGSRQPLTVVAEALRDVAVLPCLGTVTEHGAVRGSWGRSVRR